MDSTSSFRRAREPQHKVGHKKDYKEAECNHEGKLIVEGTAIDTFAAGALSVAPLLNETLAAYVTAITSQQWHGGVGHTRLIDCLKGLARLIGVHHMACDVALYAARDLLDEGV